MSEINEKHSNEVSEMFITAFKHVQKQAADAHEEFQKTLTQAHEAYLKSTEESFKNFAKLVDQSHNQIDSQTIKTIMNDMIASEADIEETFMTQVLTQSTPFTRQGALKSEGVKETLMENKDSDQSEAINAATEDTDSDQSISSSRNLDPIKLGSSHELEKIEGASAEPSLQKDIKNQFLEQSKTSSSLTQQKGINDKQRKVFTIVETPQTQATRPVLWPILSLNKVFVSGSGTTLAPYFCELLRKKGINVTSGTHVPPDARAVIFLGGLRPSNSKAEATRINLEAFRIAKEASQVFGQSPGIFISVQDSGGLFGERIHDPYKALVSSVSALIASLKQEQPMWITKLIDIEQGMKSYEQIALSLMKEIAFGNNDSEVGLLANGKRFIFSHVAAAVEQGQNPLRDNDCLIITEGAKKQANLVLEKLESGLHLKLVYFKQTRNLSPNEDYLQTHQDGLNDLNSLPPQDLKWLHQWKSLGHDVELIHCNLLDSKHIKHEIESLKNRGFHLAGLVHSAANFIDYKFIDKKNNELFNKRFAYKSQSLKNLLESLETTPLKMIIFISSIIKNPKTGLCDQYVAREICHKAALIEAHNRGSHCLVKSLALTADHHGSSEDEQVSAHSINSQIATRIARELSQAPASTGTLVTFESTLEQKTELAAKVNVHQRSDNHHDILPIS